MTKQLVLISENLKFENFEMGKMMSGLLACLQTNKQTRINKKRCCVAVIQRMMMTSRTGSSLLFILQNPLTLYAHGTRTDSVDFTYPRFTYKVFFIFASTSRERYLDYHVGKHVHFKDFCHPGLVDLFPESTLFLLGGS